MPEHTPPKWLPPGQQAILRSFAKHGRDSLYVASDIMDLRVCSAMVANGLLARFSDPPGSYELTDEGARHAGLATGARDAD